MVCVWVREEGTLELLVAVVRNALSFDVEDWFQVYNYEGLIPRSTWDACELRVEANMARILAPKLEADAVLPDAEDDANHPYLGQCVELIRRFQAENKPILGVCLGAQLIARAAGKKVYRMETTEFGVSDLRQTAAGENDPLLRDVRNPAHLMQWHEDSFELPDDAALLMTNELCTNQVFRLGETTYGFQPHIEAKPEHIHQWIEHSPDAARKANPEFFAAHRDVIAANAGDMKAFAEAVGRAWFELVRARR